MKPFTSADSRNPNRFPAYARRGMTAPVQTERYLEISEAWFSTGGPIDPQAGGGVGASLSLQVRHFRSRRQTVGFTFVMGLPSGAKY